MNTADIPLSGAELRSEVADSKVLAAIRARVLRAVSAVWKWVFGAAMCMSPITAILAVGWAYRAAQRSAVKSWWKRGTPRDRRRGGFRAAVSNHPELMRLAAFPNWILGQNALDDVRGVRRKGAGSLLRAGFGSLAANAVVGFRGVVNSFLITILPGVIMLFAWHAGWNNSFYKVYEQHWVGYTSGFVGIALLTAAMTYLPIAQARQAVTGSWGAFFHFRKVRSVIRRRPIACFFLALGYAALGFFFIVAEFMRGTAGTKGFLPELADMTAAQQLAALNAFYFGWCLFVLPAYLLLRVAAARTYAGGVRKLLRSGRWTDNDLSEIERAAARTFPDQGPEVIAKRRWAVRFAAWAGWTPMRVAAVLALLGFVLQIYVVRFPVSEPTWWLRHPLIQMPWYHQAPAHLKEAAAEEKQAAERSGERLAPGQADPASETTAGEL